MTTRRKPRNRSRVRRDMSHHLASKDRAMRRLRANLPASQAASDRNYQAAPARDDRCRSAGLFGRQPDLRRGPGPLSPPLRGKAAGRRARRAVGTRQAGSRRFREKGASTVQASAVALLERNLTFGERVADKVATFGGSWTLHPHLPRHPGRLDGAQRRQPFIAAFRPLSFHPAQPRPLLHRGPAGAGHHDEPAPPGGKGPAALGKRLQDQPARPSSKSGSCTRRSTTRWPTSGSGWRKCSRSRSNCWSGMRVCGRRID